MMDLRIIQAFPRDACDGAASLRQSLHHAVAIDQLLDPEGARFVAHKAHRVLSRGPVASVGGRRS
jgi:hypothetical protein